MERRMQAAAAAAVERALDSTAISAWVAGEPLPAPNVAGYTAIEKQLRALSLTPWVYKAVDMIAKAVSTTPMWVEVAGARDDEHPLAALLRAPNQVQSWMEFAYAFIAYYEATGNAFIYVERPSDLSVMLWALHPCRVDIVPDANNYIAGYKVEGRREMVPADQMIHWKTWNPYNDYWGLSPIQALAYTIEANAGARRFTEAFYRNGARFSGFWTTDLLLPRAETERIKAEMKAEYTGSDKAWKMPILSGGLKYQPFSLSQADMQIIAQMNLDRDDILAVFGIPLGLVSENATEANANTAYNTFATWTLYPLMVALCDKLSSRLGVLYGPDVRVACQDVRPKDKQGRLALLMALKDGVVGPDGLRAPVLTPNEIRRDDLDYPPLERVEPEMQFPETEPEPQPTRPALPAGEGRAAHWHVNADERAALDAWRLALHVNLERGIEPGMTGAPAIAATIEPLLRECISDLLAGAHSAEEIDDAFKAPFADETYP
jgi:HK97 family phage portal protein